MKYNDLHDKINICPDVYFIDNERIGSLTDYVKYIKNNGHPDLYVDAIKMMKERDRSVLAIKLSTSPFTDIKVFEVDHKGRYSTYSCVDFVYETHRLRAEVFYDIDDGESLTDDVIDTIKCDDTEVFIEDWLDHDFKHLYSDEYEDFSEEMYEAITDMAKNALKNYLKDKAA